MNKQQLINVLNSLPDDIDIEVGLDVYSSPEDSVGCLQSSTLEYVYEEIRKKHKKEKARPKLIILSASAVGYPLDRDDYIQIFPPE